MSFRFYPPLPNGLYCTTESTADTGEGTIYPISFSLDEMMQIWWVYNELQVRLYATQYPGPGSCGCYLGTGCHAVSIDDDSGGYLPEGNRGLGTNMSDYACNGGGIWAEILADTLPADDFCDETPCGSFNYSISLSGTIYKDSSYWPSIGIGATVLNSDKVCHYSHTGSSSSVSTNPSSSSITSGSVCDPPIAKCGTISASSIYDPTELGISIASAGAVSVFGKSVPLAYAYYGGDPDDPLSTGISVSGEIGPYSYNTNA